MSEAPALNRKAHVKPSSGSASRPRHYQRRCDPHVHVAWVGQEGQTCLTPLLSNLRSARQDYNIGHAPCSHGGPGCQPVGLHLPDGLAFTLCTDNFRSVPPCEFVNALTNNSQNSCRNNRFSADLEDPHVGCLLYFPKKKCIQNAIPLLSGRQARIPASPHLLFVLCREQPTMTDNRSISIIRLSMKHIKSNGHAYLDRDN